MYDSACNFLRSVVAMSRKSWGFRPEATPLLPSILLSSLPSHELPYGMSHRRLKLRTDGGYARVRKLGSIDRFVVTSLKLNQLPLNFEHKFPIMYVRRLQRSFPIDDILFQYGDMCEQIAKLSKIAQKL